MKSTEQVLLEWATDEIHFDGGYGTVKVFDREGFVNLVESIKTGERWYVVHRTFREELNGRRVVQAYTLAADVLDARMAQEIALFAVRMMTPRWFARFESLKEAFEVIDSGWMLVG